MLDWSKISHVVLLLEVNLDLLLLGDSKPFIEQVINVQNYIAGVTVGGARVNIDTSIQVG